MNRVHNVVCSSQWWARRAEDELVPFGLRGVEPGDDVLEIGPGFGATTRVLAPALDRLTVLELDPGYCERLRAELGNGSGGRRSPRSRACSGQAGCSQAPTASGSGGCSKPSTSATR